MAQALYEKHKVLTYPRTDSRYLPEDMLGQVRKVMANFEDPIARSACAKGAAQRLGEADQARVQQRQGQRSPRDHSDRDVTGAPG